MLIKIKTNKQTKTNANSYDWETKAYEHFEALMIYETDQF